MTKEEAKIWLEEEYPLTIISDRYTGCYSGGNFLAFPEDYYSIPEEIAADDVTCSNFWYNFKGIVGRGFSAEQAIINLRIEIAKFVEQ